MSISESDRQHVIGLAKTRTVDRHKAYVYDIGLLYMN